MVALVFALAFVFAGLYLRERLLRERLLRPLDTSDWDVVKEYATEITDAFTLYHQTARMLIAVQAQGKAVGGEEGATTVGFDFAWTNPDGTKERRRLSAGSGVQLKAEALVEAERKASIEAVILACERLREM